MKSTAKKIDINSGTVSATRSLPPGNMGLPILGETLAFVSNTFKFVADRTKTHGRVFKTRLLGRDTVIVSGAENAQQFIDPALCTRTSPISIVRVLLAGPSLPMLDDQDHLTRKTLVMEAFKREALASYM